jgi:hypothetical protein
MDKREITRLATINTFNRRINRLAERVTARPWKADLHHGCKTIKGNKTGVAQQAQYQTEVMTTPGLADDDQDRANAHMVEALVNEGPEMLAEACTHIAALVEALLPLAEAAPYYEGIAAGDSIVTYYSSSEGQRKSIKVADAVRARQALLLLGIEVP